MGFLLGIFIAIVIIIVRRVIAFRRAQPQGMTRASWINLGWYAGAIAAIVVCEAVLPSTVLTGKPRPAIVEAPRPLDDLQWTDRTVSYETLAQTTPWAWSLGYITRSQMEQRINDDIVIARDMVKEVSATISAVKEGQWVRSDLIRQETRLTTLVNGLEVGLSDLGDLFPTAHANSTNHKTVAQADKFMVEHIKTAGLEVQKGPQEALDRANKAVADYVLSRGESQDLNTPEYRALSEARSKASSEWYESLGATRGLDLIALFIDQQAEAHDPQASLPQFSCVLPIYEERTILPSHPDPMGGPPSTWTMNGATRAVSDAVVGYVREPRYQTEAHR